LIKQGTNVNKITAEQVNDAYLFCSEPLLNNVIVDW